MSFLYNNFMSKIKIGITVLSFLIIALVYFKTATPATSYNYFILLGKQILQGKYYLEKPLPWLNELVTDEESKRWFVVYPPMPAIVSIPFIMAGLENQTYISIILGITNIILIYFVTRKLYLEKTGLLLALAFGLGTNHWFLATEGSAWYFSHICASFFLLLSLTVLNIRQAKHNLKFSSNKLNWLLSGIFLGAAYWSRLPMILFSFLFIYFWYTNFWYKRDNLIKAITPIILFGIGLAFFVLLNWSYNYIRFETIWDVAYQKIPGVLEEPWYARGIFHYSYIPRNALFALAKMPISHEGFPYLKPSLEGMSILLTSPFLILSPLLFKSGKKWIWVMVGNAMLILLLTFSHGSVGFSQFGYRFGLEAVLVLIIALGYLLKNKLIQYLFIALLILSVLINLWGIYFIRFLKIYGW